MRDEPAHDARSVERCFVSVDLVGFTALTDSHGDTMAADLAMGLAAHARASLGDVDELVKLLGDGVLVASPGPLEALGFLDRLLAALHVDDFILTTRTGVHHGPGIEVEGGDYLGAAVNLTSRLTYEARPGEIIATDAVAAHANERGDRAHPLGQRHLRHIGEAVEVFRIDLASSPPSTKLDPICHMRSSGGEFAITVRWRDRTVGFCSESCAQRFALDPENYADHLDDC